mgnify:CR=1 FL=1
MINKLKLISDRIMNMKEKLEDYRIEETKYDDGTILFFAQHLVDSLFKKKSKWIYIQNLYGYDKIETARKDIEFHFKYYNPPKIIETIIHKI